MRRIKIRKGVECGSNGGKPVVEDNVVLGCNVSRVGFQFKGNRTGVFARESHVDGAYGARLPPRKLSTIGNRFFKHVHGAPPNVKIVETFLLPATFGEDIVRGDPCGDAGDMTV